MKNMDIIKSLSEEELALLLTKEEVFDDCHRFVSLSGESFEDYDDAVRDCIAWLNANCE